MIDTRPHSIFKTFAGIKIHTFVIGGRFPLPCSYEGIGIVQMVYRTRRSTVPCCLKTVILPAHAKVGKDRIIT
jgi:hypothetical protein